MSALCSLWAPSARHRSRRAGARGERGLVVLEWLLIVGAVAGLAAVSALAVRGVLDDSTDHPARPDVLIVDAEIAAAAVAGEATELMEDNPSGYSALNSAFSDRCTNIAIQYSSVIAGTPVWTPPQPGTPVKPAKCALARQ